MTFLSLLLVILVPTCLLVVINNRNLQSNVEQREKDTQRALLEKASGAFERDISQLCNDLILLGTDSDLIQVALSRDIGTAQHERLLRILKRISAITYTHDIAEQVNIYLRHPNKVYYAGMHDVDQFVRTYAAPGDEESFLRRTYSMSLSLFEDFGKNPSGVLLAHSIALGGVSASVPNVQGFVVISQNEMRRALTNATIYPQSVAAMYNEKGDMLSHIGGEGLLSSLILETGQKAEDTGRVSIEGEAFWYIRRQGQASITYLSATPEKIIFVDLTRLSNQLLALLLLVVTLGTLTAFLLSKVFNRPIRQLFTLIKSKKRDSMPVSNRVHYIQNELTGLYNENDDLKKTISKTQAEAEWDRLLYRLLMGLDTFGSLKNTEGIVPPHVAVSIRLEHSTENVVHYAAQSSLWHALRQHAVKNRLLCVQLTSSMLVLACGGMAQAKALVAAAQTLAQPYLEVARMRIGVGGMMDGPENISVSYRQAMEMLDYRGEDLNMHVCFYDDIVQRSGELHYPVDRENQIINLLITGNGHEAILHFADVYQGNMERGISAPMRNVLCREFALTLLRATNTIGALSPVAPEIYQEVKQFVLLDLGTVGYKQYLENLYRLCGTLTEFVSIRSRDQEMIVRVRDYIREHMGEDISLENVATHFGYAPAYFSRYFKKNLGVNLKEYITRERMQLAKSLLIHSADEIQSIALRAGFTNANSFARTFRQYEGISPSLYRDKKGQVKGPPPTLFKEEDTGPGANK